MMILVIFFKKSATQYELTHWLCSYQPNTTLKGCLLRVNINTYRVQSEVVYLLHSHTIITTEYNPSYLSKWTLTQNFKQFKIRLINFFNILHHLSHVNFLRHYFVCILQHRHLQFKHQISTQTRYSSHFSGTVEIQHHSCKISVGFCVPKLFKSVDFWLCYVKN